MNDNIVNLRIRQLRSLEAQGTELGLDPNNRSKIEARLGYALLDVLMNDYMGPQCMVLFLPHGFVTKLLEMPPIEPCAEAVINVSPAVWVGPYQSDYLIEVKAANCSTIARGTLECDGHAYHDRTPEQAAHDRARDRHFQRLGIYVLRYTASEIQEDAIRCARDAIDILLERSAGHGEAA